MVPFLLTGSSQPDLIWGLCLVLFALLCLVAIIERPTIFCRERVKEGIWARRKVARDSGGDWKEWRERKGYVRNVLYERIADKKR